MLVKIAEKLRGQISAFNGDSWKQKIPGDGDFFFN
jgi:hypothetical protein